MRTTIIAAASVLVLTLSGSYAQDTIQSSDTDFYVQTSGGTPMGCGFEFTIVYVDHIYRQGALEAVQGSLTWAEMRPGLGMMLKIVGNDFTFPQGAPRPTPFSVRQGFVAVDGESMPPTKVLDCEQSTAFCATYKFADAAKVYGAIVSHQHVTVGFNRQTDSCGAAIHRDVAEAIQPAPTAGEDSSVPARVGCRDLCLWGALRVGIILDCSKSYDGTLFAIAALN
jgi:hypothetical protein